MITGKSYINRLSCYRNALKRLKNVGFIKVFSENLADAVDVTSAQVRKDFSIFGISGRTKAGYQVDELIKRLDYILGKDRIQKVILVGAGNIGTALMNYKGFESEGIKLIAAFDINLALHKSKLSIPILPLEDLEKVVKKNKVEIGIIAVPDIVANQVLDCMLAAGIKGVVNFAPIKLRGNEDTIINNVNLRQELENVIYFVNAAGKHKGINENQKP